MMRKINSLDHRIIHHSVENIFTVISDFNTYPEWFGKKVRVKVLKITEEKIGSLIQINFGTVKFFCEIVKILLNKEIVVKYTGAYSGMGTWFFFKGTNGIKVIYEIDLIIRNPFVYILSYFISLNRIHSKTMNDIFNNLEKYLSQRFNAKLNGIRNSSNSQPKIFTLPSN